MRLQVLGIGNAFTSIYYNTSFLLENQKTFLIDCPQALFRLLRGRGVEPAAIDDVIITHIHGDHTAGLETLVLWKKYVQRRRLSIWTSRSVYEELKTRFFPGFSDTFTSDFRKIVPTEFEDYVDFCELAMNGPNRVEEDLQIEIRHNWHPTPTLGLKLITQAGSIGISGDNCYNPPLLKQLREDGTLTEDRYQRLIGDWLWESDVIYHEAERGYAGPHTSESDLLALPEKVRKKIRLVHLSDDFEEKALPTAKEGEIVTFPRPGQAQITPPA